MKKNSHLFEDSKLLRKVRYKIFLVLLIITIGTPAFSQQISASLLCSGGAYFVATNQSIEFAIGDIATGNFPSGINTLTEGFIQGTPEETDINEDFLKEVDLLIFPNPSKGQLTVSYKISAESISIIDLQGREILVIQNPENSETLNIENLQSGIYLLRIIFDGNIPITRRIIKN